MVQFVLDEGERKKNNMGHVVRLISVRIGERQEGSQIWSCCAHAPQPYMPALSKCHVCEMRDM